MRCENPAGTKCWFKGSKKFIRLKPCGRVLKIFSYAEKPCDKTGKLIMGFGRQDIDVMNAGFHGIIKEWLLCAVKTPLGRKGSKKH